MGLRKTVTSVLTIIVAAWWATSERNYAALVDSAELQYTADPAFTVDLSDLERAVYCPVSVPNAKETVLLVHGTGMTPETNWDHTLLPPLVEAGFQPCYVAVPYRLLNDIQISAEYISYAINFLAQDQQISVITWSAGSLTTQWVLTFYPETRSKVKRFIALGPDFHGSWTMIPLAYLNLFSEAVIQQVPWSKFLSALVKFGGSKAQVPTTAIGSSTDLIVQPGFYGEILPGLRDTWRLTGSKARNIDLFKLCAAMSIREGKLPHVVSHDSLLWEAASHKIIFSALNNEKSHLGDSYNVSSEDCKGGVAPNLPTGVEKQHAEIMPELSDYYSSKAPLGEPLEAPLFGYASQSDFFGIPIHLLKKL